MKTRFAIVAAIAAMVAAPAMAAFTANMGPSHSTLGTLGGGSFGVDLSNGPPAVLRFGPSLSENWNGGANSDWPWGRTFCVENITFSPGSNYLATVDPSILYGAPGQLVNLTWGTRTAFATYAMSPTTLAGIFAGDGWGTLGGAWNKIMQAYFWDQQLVASNGTTWYSSLTAAQKNSYNALAALAPTGYEPCVRALNLWSGQPYVTDKQSHLVVWIPVPGAALLGVLGLGAVAWVKRRLS